MKTKLSDVKSEIESYASTSNVSELQVVEKLKDFYFNKKLTENINLYKKKKKKVKDITKDLKISHRKFYELLDKKNVKYTKYNKSSDAKPKK